MEVVDNNHLMPCLVCLLSQGSFKDLSKPELVYLLAAGWLISIYIAVVWAILFRAGEKVSKGQKPFKMEIELDYVLVPCGLLLLAIYHGWLLFRIVRTPTRTVIGLNAESRHQWVHCLMKDPLKNGVLAIQTLRNNMMASTQLAAISITLSSLISALVSSFGSSSKAASVHTFKYFAILLCFLLAFFCEMQSIRYYAHVSFLVTAPPSLRRKEHVEYVARKLNRGSLFWSLGMRAFYFSFPLLLWIFGPIPMFLSCCCMPCVLYFLDTANPSLERMYREESNPQDVESIQVVIDNSGNSSLSHPLLTGTKAGSTSLIQ